MNLFKYIVIVFVLGGQISYAQSGYLGSVNAFGLSIDGVPTRFRTIGTNNSSLSPGDVRNKRLRIITPAVSIHYSRVLGSSFEMVFNYRFTPVKSYGQFVSIRIPDSFDGFDSYPIVNEVHGIQNSLSVEGRFSRKGGIAAIGKFIGIGMTYGLLNFTDTHVTPITLGGSGGSNFWNERRKIVNIAEPVEISRTNGSFFSIRGTIGRNYPIAEKITLNFMASIPLISTYRTTYAVESGFSLFGDIDNSIRVKDGEFDDVVIITMHLYNRALLSAGVKYHL